MWRRRHIILHHRERRVVVESNRGHGGHRGHWGRWRAGEWWMRVIHRDPLPPYVGGLKSNMIPENGGKNTITQAPLFFLPLGNH
jgi:hypothetical protein